MLIAIAVLSLTIIRLWLETTRLRKEINSLKTAMDVIGNEMAALCQAGISQDNQISEHGRQLNRLVERFEHFGRQDQESPSFHAAISAVRKGADAKSLVERYGITRDAAELLIRLHGSAYECER